MSQTFDPRSTATLASATAPPDSDTNRPAPAQMQQTAQTKQSESLSSTQMAELAEARTRTKKICRAANTATFNTWSVGIFAAPSLVMGIFDLPTFLIGAGLAIVAFNESRGAKMFRRIDLRAPTLLGFNQIGLGAILVVYGIYGLVTTMIGPNYYDEQIMKMPQLAPTLEPLGELYQLISILVYGSIIVISIVFQGLTAWYYFSRTKILRAYVEQTPSWILDVHKGMPLF